MDREIPKEVRDKERKKKFIKYGAIGVAAVVCIAVLISFMRSSVNRKDLVFSEVDNGTIEVSVSASGKVVPAFEEIINSPINTRIVEVYRKGGDSVDVGTPILKLDLQSTETEYKKLLDEEQMKRYQLEQLKVNNNTYLSDLSMQVKISAMKLNRMEVELRNERYLDSLGSGTTDKVRQAELNFNTGKLELEQLRQQYAHLTAGYAARSVRKALDDIRLIHSAVHKARDDLDPQHIAVDCGADLALVDEIAAHVKRHLVHDGGADRAPKLAVRCRRRGRGYGGEFRRTRRLRLRSLPAAQEAVLRLLLGKLRRIKLIAGYRRRVIVAVFRIVTAFGFRFAHRLRRHYRGA
mgnify:CR=1 FL=1